MEETSREAVATAVQRVAGMLQRSDQLDKVEQYRRREARKKASVEARLKVLHHIKPAFGCSDGFNISRYKNSISVNSINVFQFFCKVQRLSDELAKQLWMVLQRSMVTVRRDPTMLVSVVRIIEREEKLDRRMVDRKKQTGFIPPGRPKHWKDKMFQVLEGTVSTRIEGTQAVTREADKMWLVRLLEITRKYVLDDLIVVKNLMVQCFPPHYNTFNSLYHNAVSTRVKELAWEDLEANEIVSLLTWVLNTYKSVEMMGHPDLCSEFDINQLEPLLPQEVVDDLLSKYVKTFTSNITGWLRKALETDKKDWLKETEPEADQDGYYQTTLPAIVFQMFEQNLQVAAQIDGDFKEQVLKLCLKQMNSFLMRYREEVVAYKEEHLRDRQLPQCYIQYMIAIVNNCQTFKESINSLKRKYSQALDPFDSDAAIERTLGEVVKEGCQFLLDEVFLDLESHLNELLTRKWLAGSHAVDTICVTVEDYFNDFNKVKKPFNQGMTNEALRRVVVEYLKAVMQKRITFKNADERKEGAERMIKEAEQFKFLFKKLAGEDTDRLCGSITAIAEVFKLTDPTLLFLEVTTLVSKYPDIREDHIQALLAVRGDASREMRQMIIGTLSENKVSYSGTTQPIFKDITVPTITTTMTSMTSMATAKLLK
uniref:Exocyst complex component 3 n=1 Tax=Xiphophorus couchianus TaxID=32473 RepID=A0A3B5LE83_9TELE